MLGFLMALKYNLLIPENFLDCIFFTRASQTDLSSDTCHITIAFTPGQAHLASSSSPEEGLIQIMRTGQRLTLQAVTHEINEQQRRR